MSQDILITLQEDLKRALTRDAAVRNWVMLIDTRKCVACHACTVGCISENGLPPKVLYRPVFENESGTYPNVTRTFVARPCQQCDNPPCVSVCPNKGKATFKATEGVQAGIVAINYEKCIGCAACVKGCPYKARSMDTGAYYNDTAPAVQAYEKRNTFEYGKVWNRENSNLPVGVARKCSFCVHRLAEGGLPTCVTTCIGRATYFGDANDPDSVVAKLMKENKTVTLKGVKDATPISGSAEFGASAAKPRVFYIV